MLTLDQAIQATISSAPGVMAEQSRLAQRRAIHRLESGRFTWRVQGAAERSSFNAFSPLGYSLRAVENIRESYRLGVQRPFRNGLMLHAGAEVIHSDFSQLTPGPLDISDARLTLTLPLFRGLGASAARADERAAFVDMQGAGTLYTQRMAEQIATAALAFYDCLVARDELRILQAAERQAAETEDRIGRMISAMRMSNEEIYPATATTILRKKAYRSGQAELNRRRFALASAIGIPYDRMSDPPEVRGVLPTPADTAMVNRLSGADLARRAIVRRGDYLQSITAVESARLRSGKAENARKPRLDLQAAVGFTGYVDAGRRFESLTDHVSGPSASVGLRLDIPIRGDQAGGEAAFRQAALEEAQYHSDRMLQTISADIHHVIESLRDAAAAYHDLDRAAQQFQAALQFAIEKMPLERTTPGNLLLLHDRLVEIQLEKARTVGRYAGALVQLRLVSGTLLDQDASTTDFDAARLATLPLSE